MSAAVTGLAFVLAIDHRNSLRKWYRAVTGRPPADTAALRAAKEVVLDGLLHAIGAGMPAKQAVLLADEEYGAAAMGRAREHGIVTAVAVERSGQPEFSFEYRDRFGEHIEGSGADIVKALVRYNVEGDKRRNGHSRERLAELARWLDGSGRPLMLELLVPPLADQLAGIGGDRERFDREMRPALTARAMRELLAVGLVPRYWKIEGQASTAACEELARAAGRTARTRCLVLGRGEDAAAVRRWLTLAAPVDGFGGFAIGRTIWSGPLEAWLAGRADRQAAARLIGERYLSFAQLYLAHATVPREQPGARR